jgi:hypothetical protein
LCSCNSIYCTNQTLQSYSYSCVSANPHLSNAAQPKPSSNKPQPLCRAHITLLSCSAQPQRASTASSTVATCYSCTQTLLQTPGIRSSACAAHTSAAGSLYSIFSAAHTSCRLSCAKQYTLAPTGVLQQQGHVHPQLGMLCPSRTRSINVTSSSTDNTHSVPAGSCSPTKLALACACPAVCLAAAHCRTTLAACNTHAHKPKQNHFQPQAMDLIR